MKNIVKKLSLLTFSVFVALSHLKGQTTSEPFTAGYYIINSTAQYAVVMPSGQDYYEPSLVMDSSCNTGQTFYYLYESLRMGLGEVVFAFEYSKGKFYCFDPNGRMVVFQGQNCLTKATVAQGAGVGRMNETIEILGGNKIEEGAYYWIIGQDLAKSTIKIQFADGATYDVPQTKITLYSDAIKTLVKNQVFVSFD